METLCGVCDTALQRGSSAVIGGCSHTYCPPCLLLWDESEPGFSARLLTTRKERGRWRGAGAAPVVFSSPSAGVALLVKMCTRPLLRRCACLRSSHRLSKFSPSPPCVLALIPASRATDHRSACNAAVGGGGLLSIRAALRLRLSLDFLLRVATPSR